MQGRGGNAVSTLDVTRGDLFRALAGLTARPAVDAVLRQRAEALVERIETRAAAAGLGEATVVRILRHGPGNYEVAVSAPELFAREFGAHRVAADPLVGAAIDEITGR
jgi:hypothetical protein